MKILIPFLFMLSFALDGHAEYTLTLKTINNYKNGNSVYTYVDGRTKYTATFVKKEKYYDLLIKRNGSPYFAAKAVKGKLMYSSGRSRSLKVFSVKAYAELSGALRYLLYCLESDDRNFDKPFMGGGQGKVPDGIPDKVGPSMSGSSANDDSDCRQTADCACEGGQIVTVTCNCGYVISCENVTAEVCDTLADGTRVNCRAVTRCSGRCSPPYTGG